MPCDTLVTYKLRRVCVGLWMYSCVLRLLCFFFHFILVFVLQFPNKQQRNQQMTKRRKAARSTHNRARACVGACMKLIFMNKKKTAWKLRDFFGRLYTCPSVTCNENRIHSDENSKSYKKKRITKIND